MATNPAPKADVDKLNENKGGAGAAPPEQPKDKSVGLKTYRTRFPGSTFIMPDGSILSFDYKGELETESELVQKEFDKIAGKPGSNIFNVEQEYKPAPGDKLAVDQIQQKAAAAEAAMQAQRNAQANGSPSA